MVIIMSEDKINLTRTFEPCGSSTLEWNKKRGLELLGDKLYREPFISGLQETIKNSIEAGSNIIEINICDEKTEILEYGGTGINPETFKETLATIFTESKDKSHFGIGRLGMVLSHSYTDYFSIWNGLIYKWRIMSNGDVIDYKPIVVSNEDIFSIKIIGYERIKNNIAIPSIQERIQKMFGLPIYKKTITLRFNGVDLESPLTGDIIEKIGEPIDRKNNRFTDIYYKIIEGKEGFFVVCENGIGVNTKNINSIIVYIDQTGYLPTTMSREDFQKSRVYSNFMKNIRLIFQIIIPRQPVDDELIKKMWNKVFPFISTELYLNIQTKKIKRSKRTKNKSDINENHIRDKTRLDTVDDGDSSPFLWFDREREFFIWNSSHTITKLFGKRFTRGRTDTMLLPIARCFTLLKLKNSSDDWDELKKEFTAIDKKSGDQFEKAVRGKRSIAVEFI